MEASIKESIALSFIMIILMIFGSDVLTRQEANTNEHVCYCLGLYLIKNTIHCTRNCTSHMYVHLLTHSMYVKLRVHYHIENARAIARKRQTV